MNPYYGYKGKKVITCCEPCNYKHFVSIVLQSNVLDSTSVFSNFRRLNCSISKYNIIHFIYFFYIFLVLGSKDLLLVQKLVPRTQNKIVSKNENTPPGIYPRNKCSEFQPNLTIFEVCSPPQSFNTHRQTCQILAQLKLRIYSQ